MTQLMIDAPRTTSFVPMSGFAFNLALISERHINITSSLGFDDFENYYAFLIEIRYALCVNGACRHCVQLPRHSTNYSVAIRLNV